MIPIEVRDLIDLKIKKLEEELRTEYYYKISELESKIKANEIEINILKEGGNI